MDEVDDAQKEIERENERTLKAIRDKANAMPEGEKGECPRCGEDSPRIVRGACPRCRDKYKLP